MRKLDIDVSEVKKLVELVEKHHLEELTVEEGDVSITIKGRAYQGARPAHPQAAEISPAFQAPAYGEEPAPEPHEAVPAEREGNIFEIVAPLVGVFYRAPAPDAPFFVEVGDRIEVGTDLGLIEAMKVFSPIPSEVAGVIVEIPGENGKLVHQGDVLFRVRITEE